ncbi:MAG: leucine-rich repeat protein, partial [Vagococcus sp.]|uniref:leucine-rich repeat protein n=1 Tax=Vagococcus sp. TaxID=1933889 RepID=UPI002FC9985D
MMPNVVQALDTTVMSESEEITDQKIEETSPEEEPQKFKDEPSEEIIEAEPIVVEEKMSTNLEEEKHLIVGEEPVEEENIDSNTDITPNNVVVNSMEFSFSGTDGSSTATLVGYNGTGGGVVIPSTVVNTAADWGTPSPVTTIGIGAFRSRYLTSISIPSSVTSIELSAFQNNQLRSVVIPSSVTYIGDYAFTINKLTSVTLSANVTSVGNSAFANNQLT